MHVARSRRIRTLAVVAVATGVLTGGVTAGTHLLDTDAPARSTDTIAQAGSAQEATKAGKSGKAKKSKKAGKAKGRGLECRTGLVEPRNRTFLRTVYDWPENPDAMTSMTGPGKKVFEYKLEYSSKVSATFGMTDKVLSVGLGFEVNRTQTAVDRTEMNLKERAQYRVQAGMIYKRYSFDAYEEIGFREWYGDSLVCMSYNKPQWRLKGSGTADKPWMKAFKATKIPKGSRR
ncbi:hypothetical protein ACGFMM_10030 [Streptomyces sp. NPDC048604]|uniref:hypothetical protein n=1 Tax=Streptomyces sp. NPDC048604 TaxID=3365578 RepID=UPI003717CADE